MKERHVFGSVSRAARSSLWTAFLCAGLGGCQPASQALPIDPSATPSGPASPTSPKPGGSGEQDRTWIAFDSDRESAARDIYVMRSDGTEVRRLTDAPSNETDPAFSPDGTLLAYVSDRDDPLGQIYIEDLSTHAATRLTAMSAGADQPAWSPDGKTLTFHSDTSVYLIDRDGNDLREVARGLDRYNAMKFPSFTPDGQNLVFDRNNEIHLSTLEGVDVRYLAPNTTTTQQHPSVSPDGKLFAFSGWCKDHVQIFVASIAGFEGWLCDEARAVSPLDGHPAVQPAFGPNDAIAYERADATHQIYVTSAKGGSVTNLTNGKGDDRNPSWAPAGALLPAASK